MRARPRRASSGWIPPPAFQGALLSRRSGFSPSGVRLRRHPPRPTWARRLRDQPTKGYTTFGAAASRPPGAGRGTVLGVGEVWGPSRPRPRNASRERESYTLRNFATIPRRAREAQLRAASVTCAQICGAQGRGRAPGGAPPTAGRALPHRRARSAAAASSSAAAGGRGSSCEPVPTPRRPGALRAPDRVPRPRSTCPDLGAAAAPSPREREPGAAGERSGAARPLESWGSSARSRGPS